MRIDARVDRNQSEIVAALRAAGCAVLDLHRVGSGCPDLLVVFRGATFLIECKTMLTFTDAEDAFMASWPGRIEIVTSAEGALRAIGVLCCTS